MNKLAQAFAEGIKKKASPYKPSPWDFKPVPLDDRARLPNYYTGPGTVGAMGSFLGVQEQAKKPISRGWLQSLKKKLGG